MYINGTSLLISIRMSSLSNCTPCCSFICFIIHGTVTAAGCGLPRFLNLVLGPEARKSGYNFLSSPSRYSVSNCMVSGHDVREVVSRINDGSEDGEIRCLFLYLLSDSD